MSARQVKKWGGETVPDLQKRWGRDSVYAYGSLGSTNEQARELAATDAPSGSIVVCREQTAGRGRDGREWVSPAGAGVYLSMLFRPGAGEVSPLVTILAGVDVARALNERFPGLGVTVKWPNDLIVGDRKLGGILAETAGSPADEPFLVVGVGVNVAADRMTVKPEGAVALDEGLGSVDLADVADAVIAGLERRLPNPPSSLDEASLDELDRLDWLKNKRVEHRLRDAEPIVGVAAGIAPDGALLLRPDRGALRRVVAGSIEVRER